MKTLRLLALLLAVAAAGNVKAQETEFQKPDPMIEALAVSSPLPTTYFSNDARQAVVGYCQCKLLPLAELAANEARIGGVRINTENFSETRESFFDRLEVLDVATGRTAAISGIPAGAKVKFIAWSPSGKYFCFTASGQNRTDLYRVAAGSTDAERINEYPVNTIFGTPFFFLDDETVLYKAVPADLGPKPEEGLHAWPVVQEHSGKPNRIRTYQDLISSPYDADLFEYCCTTQLAVFNGGTTRTVGGKAIYRSIDPSPDGSFLMVTTEHRPFSYIERHRTFPSRQFIMSSADGSVVKMINDTAKEKEEAGKDEKKPKAPKPAGFSWRPDRPATLVWTEVTPAPEEPKDKDKDGDSADGDAATPKEEKPERTFTDRMYQCSAPFDFETDKELVLAPEYKLGRITWCNDGIALFTESSSKQKFRRLSTFVPGDTAAARRVIYTESTEVDTLGNFPVYGAPYTVCNQYGRRVLGLDPKGRFFYETGTARPDRNGDGMAFIDRVNLKDLSVVNVWTGAAPYKERVTAITDFTRPAFIQTREAYTMVPDYHLTDLKKHTDRQITHFENPVPMIEGLITRQFVEYTRKDGLRCCGNLYLPAGYDKEKDGPLPVYMWTYPYEYKCAAECEKDRTDRYGFVKPTYSTAMIWASQGYAVLDGFTMAIVAADKDSLENDVFLDQLIMSAEAAVDFVCDSLGIGDRERLGVGGHSYGGFMTGNLLAHTRLFKAGVARSGAYNRSLTPFGFQSEGRSYWKAKEVYDEMSPFNYADKVKDAILLIHGQMDNNMGTFPVQSERFYQALVYHGATARYLQLPYESHSYMGRETILHMLYETGAWLDKYLKYK